MKPILHKGQITKWKDAQGFGFIKPDDGGKEVFLHITAINKINRRPKVGDVILYELVVEVDGKVRAANAIIEGTTTKQKQRKPRLIETIVSIVVSPIIIFSALRSNSDSSPSPIQMLTQPECNIKGNISVNTGKKIYHLPGMEDYENTRIDTIKGEKWFCSETEAIAQGWRKAPN